MATPSAPRQRSVEWVDGALQLIDQRQLPAELVLLRCDSVSTVTRAIADMTVRGAPAIGAAGAFGVALAAQAFGATGNARCDAILDMF